MQLLPRIPRMGDNSGEGNVYVAAPDPGGAVPRRPVLTEGSPDQAEGAVRTAETTATHWQRTVTIVPLGARSCTICWIT